MPRELVLLSASMPGDAVFRVAALSTADGGVPPSLTLDAGGLLARFHTAELDPVVTVVHPRRGTGLAEIERLLPGLAPAPPVDVVWWSDVLVPWGPAQDTGLRLAAVIARELGGVLVDTTLLPGD
jgi:hypothetical protein